MLSREYRLTRKRDFDILFKEGRFVGGAHVTAKVWQVEPEKYPKRNYNTSDTKIGFVVSTKVSKSAVKRNRIKRQMREVVRLLIKNEKVRQGLMIAIMAKSTALGVDYDVLEKDIQNILHRAQVLPHPNPLLVGEG